MPLANREARDLYMIRYHQVYHMEIRLNCLFHYGGKCACCGYDNLNKKIGQKSFLEMDHIAGKGRQHIRKERITNMIHWLTAHHYPSGYRILCAACNNAMEPGETVCELHKWERAILNSQKPQGLSEE